MSDPRSQALLRRQTPPHILTLILMAGMSAMAMNIFLPSLPAMADHFDTDYGVMQLSVALYLGSSAILQVFIGPVSDMFGRRPVILWGLALFVLATLGCILAPTAEIFLVFRMCQAVVAVCMVLSRAAVRDMFDEDRAASMIGYVTMGMAVVPMVGPAIGGVLGEALGWQANFWLLFGLGALTFALTWADFGETAMKSGKTLVAQFREYPELLRSPRFWGYTMAAALSSGAFFAYLGGAPFVGTEVFGLSAAQLGFYFGAPAVGYFVGNLLTGRYSVRFGINRMVLWGCVAICVGLVLNIAILWAGLGSAPSFFGLMTLVGLGNGLALPSAASGAMSVRPHIAGTASGLSGAIMLAGGAALSALAGSVLTPGSGALLLLYIMLATGLLAVLSIYVVIWRARQLGLER